MKIIRESFTFDDLLLEPGLHSGKSRKEIDLTTYAFGKKLTLPIIAAPMDTVVNNKVCTIMQNNGGLGILPRFEHLDENFRELKMLGLYGVLAIGIIGEKELEDKINRLKPNSILIEVAHAHQKPVLQLAKHILNNYPHLPLTVGNVASPRAIYDFIRIGVTEIKLGVGPGSLCSTRTVTGCGVTQGTAIREARNVIDSSNKSVRLIADGGIKNSGDIVKALALGADSVMIGTMIGRTWEAPGDVYYVDNKPYKNVRGMASEDVMKNRGIKRIAEGVSRDIPILCHLESLLNDFRDGIQSGLSYLGFDSLNELKTNRDSIIGRIVMPGSYRETGTI